MLSDDPRWTASSASRPAAFLADHCFSNNKSRVTRYASSASITSHKPSHASSKNSSDTPSSPIRSAWKSGLLVTRSPTKNWLWPFCYSSRRSTVELGLALRNIVRCFKISVSQCPRHCQLSTHPGYHEKTVRCRSFWRWLVTICKTTLQNVNHVPVIQSQSFDLANWNLPFGGNPSTSLLDSILFVLSTGAVDISHFLPQAPPVARVVIER